MADNISINVNFKHEDTKYLNTVKHKQILMCSFEDVMYISDHSHKIIDNFISDNDSGKIISNIKPEIGKKRPVLILKPIKSLQMAVVIPLTTKKPHSMRNKVYIPKNTLPGILANEESWALCHLLSSVSIKRLTGVYQSNNSKKYVPLDKSVLNKTIFNNVREVVKAFLNV